MDDRAAIVYLYIYMMYLTGRSAQGNVPSSSTCESLLFDPHPAAAQCISIDSNRLGTFATPDGFPTITLELATTDGKSVKVDLPPSSYLQWNTISMGAPDIFSVAEDRGTRNHPIPCRHDSGHARRETKDIVLHVDWEMFSSPQKLGRSTWWTSTKTRWVTYRIHESNRTPSGSAHSLPPSEYRRCGHSRGCGLEHFGRRCVYLLHIYPVYRGRLTGKCVCRLCAAALPAVRSRKCAAGHCPARELRRSCRWHGPEQVPAVGAGGAVLSTEPELRTVRRAL